MRRTVTLTLTVLLISIATGYVIPIEAHTPIPLEVHKSTRIDVPLIHGVPSPEKPHGIDATSTAYFSAPNNQESKVQFAYLDKARILSVEIILADSTPLHNDRVILALDLEHQGKNRPKNEQYLFAADRGGSLEIYEGRRNEWEISGYKRLSYTTTNMDDYWSVIFMIPIEASNGSTLGFMIIQSDAAGTPSGYVNIESVEFPSTAYDDHPNTWSDLHITSLLLTQPRNQISFGETVPLLVNNYPQTENEYVVIQSRRVNGIWENVTSPIYVKDSAIVEWKPPFAGEHWIRAVSIADGKEITATTVQVIQILKLPTTTTLHVPQVSVFTDEQLVIEVVVDPPTKGLFIIETRPDSASLLLMDRILQQQSKDGWTKIGDGSSTSQETFVVFGDMVVTIHHYNFMHGSIIRARFLGDGNHLPSTSEPLSIQVQPGSFRLEGLEEELQRNEELLRVLQEDQLGNQQIIDELEKRLAVAEDQLSTASEKEKFQADEIAELQSLMSEPSQKEKELSQSHFELESTVGVLQLALSLSIFAVIGLIVNSRRRRSSS